MFRYEVSYRVDGAVKSLVLTVDKRVPDQDRYFRSIIALLHAGRIVDSLEIVFFQS